MPHYLKKNPDILPLGYLDINVFDQTLKSWLRLCLKSRVIDQTYDIIVFNFIHLIVVLFKLKSTSVVEDYFDMEIIRPIDMMTTKEYANNLCCT